MSDGAIAIVVAVAGLLGSALNVWMTLRLKVGLLESEKKILDQVGDEFVRVEVCEAKHPEAARPAAPPALGKLSGRVWALEHKLPPAEG